MRTSLIGMLNAKEVIDVEINKIGIGGFRNISKINLSFEKTEIANEKEQLEISAAQAMGKNKCNGCNRFWI